MPFKWEVAFLIFSVVSCKSNKVLPQDGHEIYSVLENLVLAACRIPNEIWFNKGTFSLDWALIKTPSPKPSQNKEPISIDELIKSWSFEIFELYFLLIITGVWLSNCNKSINIFLCSE